MIEIMHSFNSTKMRFPYICRCDFFLLKNHKFVLNECCSYLWPSDNFFSEGIYEQAYHDLLSNYYKIASPMVEIVSIDSYVYRVTQNYTSCVIGDARYMTFSCHFYIVKGTTSLHSAFCKQREHTFFTIF